MSLQLRIVTICLDGAPWIFFHLPIFNRLKADWSWRVAHGVAANVKDTRWMRPQDPRLSNDGTTEYLHEIARQHPRVRLIERTLWQGKVDMVNACLEDAPAPCVVMQIDSDEIWTTEQIDAIVAIFEAHRTFDSMQFWCRYYLGHNIVIGPRDGKSYGCRQTEWTRAWRMSGREQRFVTHEPPVLSGCAVKLGRDATSAYGLEFDHFAYATRRQVEYKERVYGYQGAVGGWERLQQNTVWPTKLKPFMPWVDEQSTADLLIR